MGKKDTHSLAINLLTRDTIGDYEPDAWGWGNGTPIL